MPRSETSLASPSVSADRADPKQLVLAILEENRVMALATLRRDGWPQATTVGYVYDDLTLFCAVARSSQKFENIQHDNRVSVAIAAGAAGPLRGLSMAARATEVRDPAELEHLNMLLSTRYHEQQVFSPREASAAILTVAPHLISLVDLAGRGEKPQLLAVERHTSLRPVDAQALAS